MKYKESFEKVYEKPGAVWTVTEPPKELIELIEIGKVKPCKVLDVGCGEGFYAIYFASKGFEVTGVDFSEKAIEYAKENARKAGVKIRFEVMNVMDLSGLKDEFDFVFEWAVMHHVQYRERKRYVEEVYKVLREGGKYFSICFNDQNPDFGKVGDKERFIPEDARALTGQTLYFSSLEELEDLFKQKFKIIKKKIIRMSTSKKQHIGNYFFMEKLK